MTRLFSRIAATAMVLFWATAASAVTPYLFVNNDPNGSVTVCGGTMTVFGAAAATLYGKYKYAWTLYRDGERLASKSQEIECDYPGPCQLPAFSVNVTSASGTWQLKLITKQGGVPVQTEYSNSVAVTAAGSCAER